MIKQLSSEILARLEKRFNRLYGPRTAILCIERLAAMTGRYGIGYTPPPSTPHWDEHRIILISYADMIQNDGQHPLVTLSEFAKRYLTESIDTIHLLPFFPFSSDDGFSVIDYRQIAPANGCWADIEALSHEFNLMFDLVLNHVSRESAWFKYYTADIAPYRTYFLEVDTDTDLSSVVRPRNTPLLTTTHKNMGETHVWTTFSEDQIDLNFADPNVLFEFLDILFFYISMGASIIRLDAIAYLWKQIGSSCIHLSQTHEIVKILRDILDMVAPNVALLTETNVPHEENISYFGENDEAHMVYQFSLPPLLLHALTTANSHYLTDWAQTVSAPPSGCTYINFTASHDGIGVRPLSGLIPDEELETLIERIKKRGGRISTKRNSDGTNSPYELNITYFDALGGDSYQIDRFLCSQTIMLALKGVPAVYFHSLTATPNDCAGMKETGRARSINRKKWNAAELEKEIHGKGTTAKVFSEYRRRLKIRTQISAFHPDAAQCILNLNKNLFALLRRADTDGPEILCLSNISPTRIDFNLDKNIPSFETEKPCTDLLSGTRYSGTHKQISLCPYQTVWLKKNDKKMSVNAS